MLKASEALDQLIKHRKAQWEHHCKYVLDNLLLPMSSSIPLSQKSVGKRNIILIENRINDQWLFTVLNSWLMAPKDGVITLICDNKSKESAHNLVQKYTKITNLYCSCGGVFSGTDLSQTTSFNAMMKSASFWARIPAKNY